MSDMPHDMPRWRFHRERERLIAEAHARPSLGTAAPAEILHVAFSAGMETYRTFFAAVGELENVETLKHVTAIKDGIRIKLEKHSEFMSCTLFRDGKTKKTDIDLQDFLTVTFPMAGVEIYVLLKVNLVKKTNQLLKRLPAFERIYGGSMRDDINVCSTFKPDRDGMIHFVVQSKNLTADELGRRLQRLLEVETYRTMALLGLPSAQNAAVSLSVYERELDTLMDILGEKQDSTQEEDEDLFQRLSDLSERNNRIAFETRYRFSASRAYFTIFQQRLDSLEEEKVGDLQTISGFLRSRLEPAMATIESTAKRHETLTNDLSRALVLLQTRIELNLAKGNQSLLQSMDRRHNQHLNIARTVEGLSVVAITYYATGLLSYLLKAIAKQPWMPFSDTFLTALSVPFVLALVWYGLHRIRKNWQDRD